MQVLKIIFVNRYFYPDHSATSQMLSDLAFFLENAGIHTAVVTSRQIYDNPESELTVYETISGVRVNRVRTTCFGRRRLLGRGIDYLTFYVSVAWRLGVSLSRGDVVIAMTDPPMLSVVVAAIARLSGATLVNWCHDLFPEVAAGLGVKGMNGLTLRLLKAVRNFSLRSASMNVVLGELMAKRLAAEGISQERVKVIHNWADGEQIRPSAREANVLHRDWGTGDKFIVGYSGNLGRVHDFVTILDAAELLHDRDDIMFFFIGGGAQKGWLEDEVLRRGLQNVHFKPYQPREMLAVSLTLPDLHVISLRPELEGLIVPSKFYGIAAAGRPTLFVGDPQGEIARILEEEKCGYTCGVGDAEGAKAVIETLASDQALCNELGKNARNAFERRFDMNIALEAWRKTLNDALTTKER